MVQILICIINQSVDGFVQPLIVMGVLSAACSGYAFVKLGGHLPLIVYVAVSLIFPVNLIVNFVMITLAAVPHKIGVLFNLFWEGRLTKREGRMQLRSCPPCGYSFGFIDTLRMQTALSIADIIVNFAATLALLG